MRKVIPYGRQNITEEDIRCVSDALKSDFLTQGPIVKEFEVAFAKYVGSKYAVAVANGTAALHLSALALNIKNGDKVITTPLTFAATANCVRYCGGEVIFSDIDPDTYLIDLNKLRDLLSKSEKGTYKGIIPVDFGGRAVDLEALKKIAIEYDLWIIEDACHAPGGGFIDELGVEQLCGSCNYADLAIFSLHPVKHVATGEGGVITTNSEELYFKLLNLRTHGIVRDCKLFLNPIEDTVDGDATEYPSWYMEMQELGYNYRLTDFQCALGISQLARANFGIEKRNLIAKKYNNAFKDHPNIKISKINISKEKHAYHLYVIEADDRHGLYNHLKNNLIFAQVHYYPLHLMPYYRKLGWKKNDFPVVEKYYNKCLSLPMYPTLTNEEQDFVIKCINEYYE